MFGYIVPDKPEMKIKEFEYFRAYYCGVCKAMGKTFGPLARFALSYDSVFLGLFLSSLEKEKANIVREGCFANPIKKKHIVKESKALEYAADINIILTYYKLKDNWKDEKNLLSNIGCLSMFKAYKKACRKNINIDEIIKNSIEKLSKLEEQKCSSMDMAAEPFADMMRNIIREACKNKDQSVIRAAEWIGYNLGKWIYIIDAYDDIEKDIKKENYNPLLIQYKYEGEGAAVFKSRIKKEVEFNLVHSLSQISKAVELLELDNKSIIDNIVYLGMYKKTEDILGKRRCDKSEKSL